MAFYGSATPWSKKQWLRSSSGGLRTKLSPREGATAGKSQGSERPHGEGLEQGFLILHSQNSAILSVVFLAIMASTSIRFASLIYDCNLQKHEPGSQTKVLYQVCVASTHEAGWAQRCSAVWLPPHQVCWPSRSQTVQAPKGSSWGRSETGHLLKRVRRLEDRLMKGR